jgi:hypothetical protein
MLAGSIGADLVILCSATHKLKFVSTDNVQHNRVVINRSVNQSCSRLLNNYELKALFLKMYIYTYIYIRLGRSKKLFLTTLSKKWYIEL